MKKPFAKVVMMYAVADESAVESRARVSWERAKRRMDAMLELLFVVSADTYFHFVL